MGSHYNGLSLGILYVAAVLRDHGHQVGVLNADYENRSDYLDQTGIFRGHDQYKRIHEDPEHPIWNNTVEEILAYNPEYLGITMYTANYRAARIIASKVKKAEPGIKIVVGGVHPTLAPEETLTAEEFDFVVSGEGEYVMLQLVNGDTVDKIPGLGYKIGGRLVINPQSNDVFELDSIPFPARELIINPLDNTDFGQLVTGRGCPYSCTYCASPAMWSKKKVRLRSVDNVMGELFSITEHYPYNIIYFEDDTFTMKKERTLDLCNRITESDLDIQWKCDTRADCISDSLVKHMKHAGCICIKMGVESGSQRILNMIHKKVTKNVIRNAARIIQANGIPLTIYLMAGFPNETDEDLQETIRFAHEIDANYYSLSIAAPYYGTKIYDELSRRNGGLHKEHWEYFYHQSRSLIMNSHLSEGLVNEYLNLNAGRVRI